jgi:hypothetical protein
MQHVSRTESDAHALQEHLAPADVYKLPTEGLRGVPKEVILYQYDVCPFCCKVKAVLDYYRVRFLPQLLITLQSTIALRNAAIFRCADHACCAQIPYRCVEVGPLMKTELKWSEYKKVPLAPTCFILQPSKVHTCDSTQHTSCGKMHAVHTTQAQRCKSISGAGGDDGWRGAGGQQRHHLTHRRRDRRRDVRSTAAAQAGLVQQGQASAARCSGVTYRSAQSPVASGLRHASLQPCSWARLASEGSMPCRACYTGPLQSATHCSSRTTSASSCCAGTPSTRVVRWEGAL